MNFVPIAEVTNIFMGQSPPSSTYNLVGNGLPFFQGKTDFGELYPKVRVFCTQPTRIAEANDILISVRAPVGPTNINLVKSCIGRGLAAIRCTSKIHIKYLLYCLRFYESDLALIGKGSTFEAINRDDLENFQIPLPPVAEQKRIAAILEKCDRLRRTRRYALQLSDKFLQSVFLEKFGDPASNPNVWKAGTLEDVIISAKDGPHVSPIYSDSGIPFLSTRNVRKGEIIWEGLKFISIEDAKEHWKKCKPECGDILYTKGGTTGLAKAIDFHKEIAVWVHIAVLKLRRDLVNPTWLESMLNSDFCYKQSQELTFGIVNRDLGLQRMPKIKIYIPPVPIQEKFAQIVQKFERLRTQQRESDRQAEHLFQTLLHQAFRGELTSSDFNDEAVSVFSQEISVQQPKPKSTVEVAEYLHTKVNQQETEAVQLTLPGLE